MKEVQPRKSRKKDGCKLPDTSRASKSFAPFVDVVQYCTILYRTGYQRKYSGKAQLERE